MTRTLRVALTEAELRRLGERAALDCRRPQEQVRYFVLNALGLLDSDESQNANSDVNPGQGSHVAAAA